MGAKQSSTSASTPRARTFSGSGQSGNGSDLRTIGASSATTARLRARSLGSFAPSHSGTLTIPTTNGNSYGAGSPDSDASTPEEGPSLPRHVPHSLPGPLHLIALHGKLTYMKAQSNTIGQHNLKE